MENNTMKKNLYRTSLLLSVVATLVFSACSQKLEELIPVNEENGDDLVTEVLTLQHESQTKATLGNENSNPTKAWEDTDYIGVWTGTSPSSGSLQCCSVSENTISVNLYGGNLQRYNYAVYPYKYSLSGSVIPTFTVGEGTLSVDLPNTYDYAELGGIKNTVPMVAKNLSTDGSTLTFYSVGALARIFVSAIPSRADKLVVSFDKTVTGSFTVQDLSTLGSTNAPYIAIDPASSASIVTINLTPGADYAGAVINIPVPTGTVNVISVAAYDGETLLKTLGSNESKLVSNWDAKRAHGKKVPTAFTPSIGCLIVSPGKVYTDGEGELQMADNWYSHMYVLSGAVDENHDGRADDIKVNSFGWDGNPVGTGYSIANRTYLNWNEMYHLFHGTTPTWAQASDNTSTGTENSATSYPMSKEFSKITWRVPFEDDFLSMLGTVSRPRPGAALNGIHGLKTLRILVTGMNENEGTTVYSISEGVESTNPQDADYIGPSTTCQGGVLFLPDNVELSGTFTSIDYSRSSSGYLPGSDYYSAKITKANLETLISNGCAFFPALGMWNKNNDLHFNSVGIFGCYWSNTQEKGSLGVEYYDGAFYLGMNRTSVNADGPHYKYNYQSIRLVRDAFPVE